MAALAEAVRSVALIVLFSAFIELLLPQKDFAPYVRLIMGLFVMAALLTPILELLDESRFPELTAWVDPLSGNAPQSVLAEGRRLSELNDQLVLEEYRARLVTQIETVAEFSPGIARAQATVELEEGEGPFFGSIRQVQLTLTPGSRTGPAAIEPVEIGPSPSRPPGETDFDEARLTGLGNQVKASVANSLGITPGQVNIQWTTGEQGG